VLLQRVSHVRREEIPQGGGGHVTHVQLLRELIKYGSVAVLVLFDDRGEEGDQPVPKLEVVLSRTGVFFRVSGAARAALAASSICILRDKWAS